MAESRMGEEEAHCNLKLEMTKEVRKNVNVTLANEDGKTNHSVLDLRRLDLERPDLRKLDQRRLDLRRLDQRRPDLRRPDRRRLDQRRLDLRRLNLRRLDPRKLDLGRQDPRRRDRRTRTSRRPGRERTPLSWTRWRRGTRRCPGRRRGTRGIKHR